MAVARKLGSFEYVLKEERELPRDKQTVWHMRTLSWPEKREIENTEWRLVRGRDLVLVDAKGVQEKLLGLGLTGWTNFKEDGTEIAFRCTGEGLSKRLAPEILDRLEPFATELANAIENGAQTTEQDAKNSSLP